MNTVFHLLPSAVLPVFLFTASCPTNAQLEKVEKITVCGGKEGLTYQRYANNLAHILKQKYRVNAEVINTEGGPDTLRRMGDAKCDLGFAQADNYMALESRAQLLGKLGMECGFVIVNTDGKVDEEDDLQDEDVKAVLSVGAQGSGSSLSWEYIVALDGKYTATELDYTSGAQAIARVVAGTSDAALFFTDPEKLESTVLGQSVEQKDELTWISFDDNSLNNDLPDGTPVYVFENIDVPGKFRNIDTICTSLLLVGAELLPADVAEAVAGLVLTNTAGITR